MINHLPIILWERRYYVLACILAMLLAGTIAAFVCREPTARLRPCSYSHKTFRRVSWISPTTGAVEQRIARIREQVLSRGDLIQLIEQNDLYTDKRRSKPLSKIIEKMRHATTRGRASERYRSTVGHQNSTIAIAMSYDYPDPVKAQAVLQSFVSKFLSMDSADVEDRNPHCPFSPGPG
jgi:hypothetical protein